MYICIYIYIHVHDLWFIFDHLSAMIHHIIVHRCIIDLASANSNDLNGYIHKYIYTHTHVHTQVHNRSGLDKRQFPKRRTNGSQCVLPAQGGWHSSFCLWRPRIPPAPAALMFLHTSDVPFIHQTWLIHMWNEVMRHDSFICMPWLLYDSIDLPVRTVNTACSCSADVPFIHQTWLIHLWHEVMRHDSFVYVTWMLCTLFCFAYETACCYSADVPSINESNDAKGLVLASNWIGCLLECNPISEVCMIIK